MSIWIEQKYISLLSPKLDRFHRVRENLWTFRCPYCGDSQKSEMKTRGYFHLSTDQSYYIYKCHNCGFYTSFVKFLKSQDPFLFQEYKLENLKETNQINSTQTVYKSKPVEFNNKPKRKVKELPMTKMEDLKECHKAVQYLNSRKINDKYRCRFSYTEDFKRLIELISPDKSKRLKSEERIVIPFFNRQNKITHIQGRALNDDTLRYITVSLSQGSKVYGLDRIDNTKPVYVVEGIFDSLFLENCVAMTGSDLNTEDLQDCELVFLFDNEPRNRQIVQKVEKIIGIGHSIVLFDDTFKGKDINDMIQSGHTIEQIKEYIENNTFKGLKAKMKFTEWRKL